MTATQPASTWDQPDALPAPVPALEQADYQRYDEDHSYVEHRAEHGPAYQGDYGESPFVTPDLPATAVPGSYGYSEPTPAARELPPAIAGTGWAPPAPQLSVPPLRAALDLETGGEPEAGAYVPDLALRGINRHLARTSTGTMAWYHLAPRAWSMRPDHEREALMGAIGLALSQLTGRWLHWRVTWRPYPAMEWARRHDQWATPLPDRPSGVSWDSWLVAHQRDALRSPKAIKEVYLGVEVRGGRGRLGRVGDALAARGGRRIRGLAERLVDTEMAAMDSEISEIDQLMAHSALGGRPVSAGDMAHLLYRSCGMGLPSAAVAPAAPHTQWDTEDLAAVDELARWTTEPYAPTVRVSGVVAGHRMTRHVAVASLGRMGELDVPAVDLPWMTVSDALSVPVEWSARMRVLDSEHAARSLRRVADRVDAQERHYQSEHGLPAPPGLHRQIEQASQVRDELDTDHTGLSARFEGWWRLAVAGDTEAEALAHLETLRAAYHPTIAVEHPEAQYHLLREFIPGEPLATRAHTRRGSVEFLATAMPQVSDIIGDTHGPLIFTAAHSGRPIGWDLWHDIDTRQSSGLTPVIGGLGAGKTFLMGTLAFHAVRAQSAFVTLIDPSGPLTRLANLPELAGYARAVDLLSAPAGTLNPYSLIPTPHRAHYPDGPQGRAEFEQDWASAEAQRITLVIDIITQLLPAAIRRDSDVQQLLLRSVHAVGTDPSHDLSEVLAALRTQGEQGERLAGSLDPILSTSGPARLLLGQPDGEVWDSNTDRLLVLSTRGLTLPREGVDQQDWGLDEQLSLPLMHLASWLAYRRVYRLPRQAPKMVGLDELRWLSMTASGRTLITQFARDNRKFRCRVLIAGQLASDVLRLGGDESGLAALCHDVFVGRTSDEQAQANALRLLRVPTGIGYESQLGQLSGGGLSEIDGMAADAPREFLWRSGDYCEQVRLDTSGEHLAGLRHALDTNAVRAGDR